jgi:hypothetical protein
MSKHKVKRYDGEDESMVEVGEPNPIPKIETSDLPPMAEEPPVAKPASFKEAFAAARKGGGKTFEYNGKKYSTELASAPAKKVPARPMSKTPSMFPVSMKDRAEGYGKIRAAARAADTADAAAKESTAAETARLRQRNMPASKFDASKVNPNTLLPKRMASGGMASSRADGIAQRGKTRGTMC